MYSDSFFLDCINANKVRLIKTMISSYSISDKVIYEGIKLCIQKNRIVILDFIYSCEKFNKKKLIEQIVFNIVKFVNKNNIEFLINNSFINKNEDILDYICFSIAKNKNIEIFEYFIDKYHDIALKSLIHNDNNIDLLYLFDRSKLKSMSYKNLNMVTYLNNIFSIVFFKYLEYSYHYDFQMIENIIKEKKYYLLEEFLPSNLNLQINTEDIIAIYIKNICYMYNLNFTEFIYIFHKYKILKQIKNVYLSNNEVLEICEYGIDQSIFEENKYNDIIKKYNLDKKNRIEELVSISNDKNSLLYNIPNEIIKYVIIPYL